MLAKGPRFTLEMDIISPCQMATPVLCVKEGCRKGYSQAVNRRSWLFFADIQQAGNSRKYSISFCGINGYGQNRLCAQIFLSETFDYLITIVSFQTQVHHPARVKTVYMFRVLTNSAFGFKNGYSNTHPRSLA